MNPRVAWLASMTADPRIGNLDIRLAVAIAGQADEHGVLKSKMSMLAGHANISARRMLGHFQRLAETGYIEAVDLTRQGRFHVVITTDAEAGAPKIEKPFREVAGAVIAAIDQPSSNGRHRMAVYVETEDEMVKVTIPRSGAEAITGALTPGGAHHAPSASL